MPGLNEKQAAFVREYLIDLNATQAAIRAGYSPATAGSQAHDLLKKPEIVEAISEAQAARAKRTEITADMVLQQFWAIASADPNDLIEYRRTCCRHCWGEGFRHQYTEGEMRTRRAAFDGKRDGAQSEVWDADGLFDEGGGIGYNATLDPNINCPECFGEGIGDPRPKDTRHLSAGGKALYAGVKVTKDGLEIKMHDKVAALTAVGRHLGMFKEHHEHTGPNGGPIRSETKLNTEGLTLEQLRALASIPVQPG